MGRDRRRHIIAIELHTSPPRPPHNKSVRDREEKNERETLLHANADVLHLHVYKRHIFLPIFPRLQLLDCLLRGTGHQRRSGRCNSGAGAEGVQAHNNIGALHDSAKHGVLVVKPRRRHRGNKKLGA